MGMTMEGETLPSADEARVRPLCLLSCPDLVAPIMRRGGAGRSIRRCLGRVAGQNDIAVVFCHERESAFEINQKI